MKIIYTGKNIEISEALKEQTEKKMKKLEKFFNEEVEAHVKFENAKNRQIMEVTIHLPKTIIRAEEEASDLYTAIDKAVDVLEIQVKKNKAKLQKRFKNNDTIRFDTIAEPEAKEEESKVVKKKRFTLKPMSTEEAILQMELLRHNFFVFVNQDTEDVDIVYKRKDGNYGLIEPIIG